MSDMSLNYSDARVGALVASCFWYNASVNFDVGGWMLGELECLEKYIPYVDKKYRDFVFKEAVMSLAINGINIDSEVRDWLLKVIVICCKSENQKQIENQFFDFNDEDELIIFANLAKCGARLMVSGYDAEISEDVAAYIRDYAMKIPYEYLADIFNILHGGMEQQNVAELISFLDYYVVDDLVYSDDDFLFMIPLGLRSYFVLKRNGVKTIGDAKKLYLESDKLKNVWHLGEKCRADIIDALNRFANANFEM